MHLAQNFSRLLVFKYELQVNQTFWNSYFGSKPSNGWKLFHCTPTACALVQEAKRWV
jgi:hypothetical protein